MGKEHTRTYRITFKDNEEGHAARDHSITKINNFLKMRDEHSTLLFLLDTGILSVLKEIAKTGDAEAQIEVDIQEKLLEIQRFETKWTNLNKLYDRMSAEDFQQWCAEKNISISDFLEWQERKETNTWADSVRKWLSGLLKDGNPIQVSAIKQMAIEAGMIDTTDSHSEKQQWDYIRQIASREGYTGKSFGCWQKPVVNRKADF